LQNTETLAKTQIRSQVSNLRQIWENIAIARRRVEIAQSTVNATDQGFRNGTVEFRDLVDTHNKLSEARQQLSHRCGLSSTIIPNVLDFNTAPPKMDDYAKTMRADMGVKDDEVLLLQPTRIIARKGIEHAIELASRLKDKKAKLLISHQERDEGSDYYNRTMEYAALLGVEVIICPDIIGAERGRTEKGKKKYSLSDCYLNADFVTYPSSYEGFGNAFLEALWFKKPILVNRYSIFQSDIEPLDFDVVIMENYVTGDTVNAVRSLLESPNAANMFAERNYEIGRKYFSFSLLEQQLRQVLMDFGQL